MRTRLLMVIMTVFWPLLAGASSNGPLTVGFLAGAGGLGDQSYNDMLFAGLGKAQKIYQYRLIYEETEASTASQKRGMARLIERGADVIFANGSGLPAIVDRYAERYPGKIFVVSDHSAEKHANVAGMMFRAEEGAFLAGVLAGHMTRSGKVGFIGGVDNPAIRSFRVGFEQGVAYANPAARVIVDFVSTGDDFSGFSDPVKGARLAERMYNGGVDIIFAVAGLTGNGIIHTAQQMDRYVIGVDADQDHMAKGHVLTSMMKRLDRAAFLEVARIVRGEFKPGTTYYNLSNGGVSLSPMKYTRHLIPDAVLEALKATESDIIAGKIQVSDVLAPEASKAKANQE
ncbi:MAG: BMP family ABC transporter substrate-binding protein [Desulfosarcinaceae bacterium]